MKIQIKGDDRSFCILLPTGLIFSKTAARIAGHVIWKHAMDDMQNIPPEAMEAICAELRRIKRKYGSWELVSAESADGELVNITL